MFYTPLHTYALVKLKGRLARGQRLLHRRDRVLDTEFGERKQQWGTIATLKA